MSQQVHELKAELKADIAETLHGDEGWREYAYKDHLGFWTIGYGRLIDKRRGGRISEDEGDYMLGNDIEDVYAQLCRRLPWVPALPAPWRRALINMGFQLGIGGLMQFKNMLKHVRKGNGRKAKKAGLNSLWARQTPNRAERVTDLFLK